MGQMADRCGAWAITGGVVQFRIFLPAGVDARITAITAGGSFQADAWQFESGVPLVRDTSDPRGDFWTGTTAPLAEGFYEYKYLVSFENGERRIVTDPCARYGGLSSQNSAVVVGGSTPADNVVRPLAGGRLPLADLNVYELMIDDFTAEYRGVRAPLDAVVEKLDDLVALGINAILFMPWTAWKNTVFDWGYEPFQYYAVEARYANDLGRPAEKLSLLKGLVSECHDRGLHVIMDGVFNHVSLSFPYQDLYQDRSECPYTAGPFGGSFPGLQDLDFANACTGELILDVCRYWTETFDLDGLRLDNTVNYYVAGDFRGLPELLSSLSSSLGRPNFSLTLEHIDVSAASVTNSTAATSFWDNSLYGATFDGLWNGGVDGRLLAGLDNRRFLAPGKVPTLYLSNHDHSQVGWQAGARANVGASGAWWRVQPYLIALFTSTAVPMIPNGQEFGEEYFLPEDDHNTGRRVIARPLRWKLRDDPIGRTLVALHGTLARLRLAHPALRSSLIDPTSWDPGWNAPDDRGLGVAASQQTVAYLRWAVLESGETEFFAVVLNFADAAQDVPMFFPVDGVWADQLAGFSGDGSTWSLTVTGRRATVNVGSHWGRLLYLRAPV